MESLTIECPDALVESLDRLVREGYIADEQQAVVEALRRFIDSHQPELIESQIRSDIEWGLHGQD
jgi:metal-responsive CopG/Arc/MetJ family transcriptional regulator